MERLAATLPLPIQYPSRRRHLQRFLAQPRLRVVLLWFPLIQEIVSKKVSLGKHLIIALARTAWRQNNLLMVSVIINYRAFPTFWLLLSKVAASNLRQQQTVLRPVLRLFKRHRVIVVGDREFHSSELAQWLHQQKVKFVLRQKKDTTYRKNRRDFQSLSSIAIAPGQRLFLAGVTWTQNRGARKFNLAVYWKRKYRGKSEQEPWYLLTNLEDAAAALKAYEKRFGIEAMFKDCKTGGYNLEDSQASPQRLSRLVLFIALALTASWLRGQKIANLGQTHYVCRPQERDTTRRRHSNFWKGLYGENWLRTFSECQEWVEQFISTFGNKRPFYQRGLKAMRLIQQAF